MMFRRVAAARPTAAFLCHRQQQQQQPHHQSAATTTCFFATTTLMAFGTYHTHKGINSNTLNGARGTRSSNSNSTQQVRAVDSDDYRGAPRHQKTSAAGNTTPTEGFMFRGANSGSSFAPTVILHSGSGSASRRHASSSNNKKSAYPRPYPTPFSLNNATAGQQDHPLPTPTRAELCYDHARQPSPNFWSDMAAEDASCIVHKEASGIAASEGTAAAADTLSTIARRAGGASVDSWLL